MSESICGAAQCWKCQLSCIKALLEQTINDLQPVEIHCYNYENFSPLNTAKNLIIQEKKVSKDIFNLQILADEELYYIDTIIKKIF